MIHLHSVHIHIYICLFSSAFMCIYDVKDKVMTACIAYAVANVDAVGTVGGGS